MQYDDSIGGYEPSEKQIKYAQTLAQRTGMPLPQEALLDRDQCSAFIDSALSKTPPTAKQIAFAATLAQAKNEELPLEVRASSKACSEYINQNNNSPASSYNSPTIGGGDPTLPTDKQLNYAATLARQKGMGISYEALSSRGGMSRFIDELLSPQADGYQTAQHGANLAGGVGMAGAGLMGSVAEPLGAVLDTELPSPGADDDLLPAAERSGDTEAPPAEEEMDDLFGKNAVDDDDDTPLFREGQIPF